MKEEMKEKEIECGCKETVENCDIFDFMANHVGLSVLHPGGFDSTRKLLTLCKLEKNKKVLDIACGKGTTSILMAKKYGCKVVGVDLCPELVEEANYRAKKNNVKNLVEFRVADATKLPFNDNEFDNSISQAILVLVNDKELAIKEALRVTKPSGLAGWIELTWRKEPSELFIEQISSILCAYCMLNVKTYDDWIEIFRNSNAQDLKSELYPMNFSGLKGMVKDEGIISTFRIFKKYITEKRIRQRMMVMTNFMKSNEEIFGYGIYTMRKKT